VRGPLPGSWLTISGVEERRCRMLSRVFHGRWASTDTPYLFERVDFEPWLAEFRERTGGRPN